MSTNRPGTRLILAVTLVTLVIAMIGCSDQRNLRLRYEAEKKLNQAEKELENARIKNELSEPSVVNDLHAKFKEVSNYSIAALDSLSPDEQGEIRTQIAELAFQSTTRLTQFLFSEGQYDSCVALLYRLSGKLKLPPLESAVVWVNIGQAHQAKGEWDKAVEVFNKALALTDPPLDQQGQVIYSVFNLPAHMFAIYAQIGDTQQAKVSFDRSITYYRTFADQTPRSKLGIASVAILSALYSDSRMWRDALRELSLLTDSTGQVNWEASVRMGDIYASQLQLFDSAMIFYDRAYGRLAGADTLARPVILFKEGLALLEEKKYDEARKQLNDLNQNYPGYFASTPMAQLAKAKTFDDEGNWDRAETEYRFLIDNYVGSDEAMSTYLYLGDQLEKRGRTVEADRWMGHADSYYQQIADRNRGTQIEALAMTYQAELLRRKADWPGSVVKLMQIFTKFPNDEIGQRAALAAAGVAREKLGNPAQADSIIGTLKRSLTNVAPPAAN